MRLVSRLEPVLGRFAVPHLALGLVICQVVVYVIVQGMNARPEVQNGVVEPVERAIALIPSKVLDGEVWRLVSFLLLPPVDHVILMLIAWYFFYWTGTALERTWGTFRFNLYLLIGWAATVAASFLTPDVPSGNGFLFIGVVLAFAWLVPDFRVILYFVLPIPVKWVAWLVWAGVASAVALGSWSIKAQAVAAVANFLLFFGREVVEAIQSGRRRMARQTAAYVAEAKKPEFYHQCRICSATDRSHPKLEFRYCSKCTNNSCYCSEHLRTHEHV